MLNVIIVKIFILQSFFPTLPLIIINFWNAHFYFSCSLTTSTLETFHRHTFPQALSFNLFFIIIFFHTLQQAKREVGEREKKKKNHNFTFNIGMHSKNSILLRQVLLFCCVFYKLCHHTGCVVVQQGAQYIM